MGKGNSCKVNETQGFLTLRGSNWTICSLLNRFCPKIFPPFYPAPISLYPAPNVRTSRVGRSENIMMEGTQQIERLREKRKSPSVVQDEQNKHDAPHDLTVNADKIGNLTTQKICPRMKPEVRSVRSSIGSLLGNTGQIGGENTACQNFRCATQNCWRYVTQICTVTHIF